MARAHPKKQKIVTQFVFNCTRSKGHLREAKRSDIGQIQYLPTDSTNKVGTIDISVSTCLSRTKNESRQKSLILIRPERLLKSNIHFKAYSESNRTNCTCNDAKNILETKMEIVLFMGVLETIAEATEIVTETLHQCEKFSYIIMNSLAQ